MQMVDIVAPLSAKNVMSLFITLSVTLGSLSKEALLYIAYVGRERVLRRSNLSTVSKIRACMSTSAAMSISVCALTPQCESVDVSAGMWELERTAGISSLQEACSVCVCVCVSIPAKTL